MMNEWKFRVLFNKTLKQMFYHFFKILIKCYAYIVNNNLHIPLK